MYASSKRIEIWRDIARPVNDRDRKLLRDVQLVLRVPQTGEMDDVTVAHIRGAQGLMGLRVTGVIDKLTYEKFMQLRWVDDAIQE